MSKDLAALGAKGEAFRNANGDWSFPISTVADLKNAIQAFGRHKPEDTARLKAYISRRARALGSPELIPDAWGPGTKKDGGGKGSALFGGKKAAPFVKASADEPGDTELAADEVGLIVSLAGRLDWSPKKNWVENEGGLPKYIEDIALALIRGGMKRERAIATAISRVKKWAAGGDDVKADTRAKAAKALAAWEKMKASAKAKRVKRAGSRIAASGRSTPYSFDSYLALTATSYNTDVVRRAWETRQREARAAWRAANPGKDLYDSPITASPDYSDSCIDELWTDFIIVRNGSGPDYIKVPYTVDDSNAVTFGEPVPVKQVFAPVTTPAVPGWSLAGFADALKKLQGA